MCLSKSTRNFLTEWFLTGQSVNQLVKSSLFEENWQRRTWSGHKLVNSICVQVNRLLIFELNAFVPKKMNQSVKSTLFNPIFNINLKYNMHLSQSTTNFLIGWIWLWWLSIEQLPWVPVKIHLIIDKRVRKLIEKSNEIQ